MWWEPPVTPMASAPPLQSEGLSVQLFPTTFRLRKITLDEAPKPTWPLIWAPQTPMIVLFEPTLKLPLMLPFRWITLAPVPLMFDEKSAALVTTTGVRLPPPVVPLPFVAQPTRGGGAGGVVQPPLLPPVLLPPVLAPPLLVPP